MNSGLASDRSVYVEDRTPQVSPLPGLIDVTFSNHGASRQCKFNPSAAKRLASSVDLSKVSAAMSGFVNEGVRKVGISVSAPSLPEKVGWLELQSSYKAIRLTNPGTGD